MAWKGSFDNVGVVGYGVYRDLLRIATPVEPAVTISGLTCGSTFKYAVDAVDAAGNRSPLGAAYVQTAPCADVVPPSAPSNLALLSRTTGSLVLSWSRATDNVAVAGYRVSSDGRRVTSVSQTSVTLSDLACGTTYAVGVEAFDAAGNYSQATTVSVATAPCTSSPDSTPPSTPSGLSTSNVTQTSLILAWNASVDNVGVSGYDVYRNGSKVATVASTSSAQTGLSCGTSYRFAVAARDGAGNISQSAELVAPTSACSPAVDTTAPSEPTGLTIATVTRTSVALTWSPSIDNVGVVGYGAYVDGALASMSSQPGTTLTNLTCGTSYRFEIDAFDAAGNRSRRAVLPGATSACADTQPPTAPANVTTTSRTTASIALTWSPSTDNVAVLGYRLYQGGAPVGTTNQTTGIFSNLACNANYTLAVAAYDAAGNHSPPTTIMAATTACPDTTPPSPPSALVTSNITQSSLTLAWNASTDNVGVTGYDVYRNGTKVASVNATSANQTGLSCGTSYALAVVGRDAAGNASRPTELTTSTLACSSPSSTGTRLYGVHQDLNYFGAAPDARIAAATGLGAKVSRSSFLWNQIEKTKGSFDWSVPDGIMQRLTAAGIVPVWYPINAPSWANGSNDPVSIPQGSAFTKFVQDYADFVRAASARYKGVRWEIWNEPNEKYFWHPAPSDAAQYTQLYNAARAAILQADPTAKVAVGGLTGLVHGCCISGISFLTQMIQAGAQVDYVGIHPYDEDGSPLGDTPYQSNFTDIARVKAALDALGKAGIKYWVTEFGWSTAQYGEAAVARMVTEALTRIRSDYTYVDVVTYFFDIDTPDYPGYGLYTTSFQPKQSGNAFRTFVSAEQ